MLFTLYFKRLSELSACGFETLYELSASCIKTSYAQSAYNGKRGRLCFLWPLLAVWLFVGVGAYADTPRRLTPSDVITKIKDKTIKYGDSVMIAGEFRRDADIFFTEVQGADSVYRTAHRLTVLPPPPQDFTLPYLSNVTPKSICISWKSKVRQRGCVRYGEGGNLVNSIIPRCERLADDYWWYTARITHLSPNTEYSYCVEQDRWQSEVYKFRTSPSHGSHNMVRILVIGDHQMADRSGYEWLMQAAARKIEERYGEPLHKVINFLLNTGDQVDAGTLEQYEGVHLFKSALMAPTLPVMTVVGNHEPSSDPALSHYSGHFDYESLSYRGISSGTDMYYAFQVGRVLMVMMNSQWEFCNSSQLDWIRRVVDTAAKDDDIDFIVSVQHIPIAAEMSPDDICTWMRDKVMPILGATEKHVLNISGHHHLYHRGAHTLYPFYHMVSGGTEHDQLWGTRYERNCPDIQGTFDQWTYQILEFDLDEMEMRADCYSIGNKDIVVDNVCIDSFRRRLHDDELHTPRILAEKQNVVIPTSLQGSRYSHDEIYPLSGSEWQLSTSRDFRQVAFDRVEYSDDWFRTTGLPYRLPINRNDGIDLTRCSITERDGVAEGWYYARVRYRDDNLDWSDWSSPVRLRIKGGKALHPKMSIDRNISTTRHAVTVRYTDAQPGGWIGVYKNVNTWLTDTPVQRHAVSSSEGEISIKVTEPGDYYLVMFEDEGYVPLTPRCSLVVGIGGRE